MTKTSPVLILSALFLALWGPLAGQAPSTWRNRGVGAGGALYSPSINPANDSEYYVASDMSGLYHTVDFGNSYSTVSFLQVQGGHESAVRFTSNPLIAYTVTYTGGNNALPAKTTDGGTTWTVLPGNPLPYDDTYSIWVDYDNPSRVIIAGYSDLYISSNGGTSFSPINVAVDDSNGVLVCGAFFDGNNIYLGTNAGLLVSANGGASFANAGTPGIPAGELMLSFTGAKVGAQTRFFCLTAESSYPGIDLGSDYYANYRGIYSLENGAGSWTARTTGINAGTDFLLSVAMARNDLNTVYAAGGSSAGVPVVFKTANAGGLWTNTFRTTNNQNINTGWSGSGGDRGWGYGEVVFGLAVAPGNSARAVFTDYGFAHRTSDGGNTWQQAYVSPADQHAVNTTAISGGSYHSIGLEDTTTWQVFWTSAQHLFAGFSDIKGVRSLDGGVTWTLGYTGHNANSMYRLTQHPVSHALYAATSDIHDLYQSTRLADSPLNNADANGKVIVSTNEGASWQTVHSFGHPVFWLCLDPANPNRMYASVVHSTAGGVFVTSNLQDGAASIWTKLSNPPRTEGHPATIVVLNDGKVVCTYSGRRTSVFTASSGVFIYDPATQAWADVSDAGMRYWTKDIVVDPADATQNTWYVGVFSGWGGPPNGLGGLYRTTDRGAHWNRINNLDRVTSVTFAPDNSNQAYLTTETDGLWYSSNIRNASPAFTRVSGYPFRQPERVFFNPYNQGEVWVTSFGGGLMVGESSVAPAFTTQPASQTAVAGSPVTFTAAASGAPAPTYQWRKDGVAIGGATNASFALNSVQPADAGTYTVVATNATGSVTSNGAVLTITTAPLITQQPAGQTVNAGGSITFTAAASGNPTPTYQWRRNGVAIPGATGSSYTIASVTATDAASYAMVATNAAGTVTSNAAVLNVQYAPVFTLHPAAHSVTVGANITLSTAVNANPAATYQWKRDGVDIAGATGVSYAINNAQVTDTASYSVVATNAAGSTTSNAAGLTVAVASLTPVPADFNNDGHPDIVWRNVQTGAIAFWLMNGTAMQSATVVGAVTADWTLAGTGDFNNDGNTDLLWRKASSGAVAVWLMNGTAMQSTATIANITADWRIDGTGDFNGDGKVDILWRKESTGAVALWLMDGLAIQSTPTIATITADWKIGGTGDFNGDGKVDILWRKESTGAVALWLMDGLAIQSTPTIANITADWKISGTGDFNGDGKVDILWRKVSTGAVALWLMDGLTIQSTPVVANITADWVICN